MGTGKRPAKPWLWLTIDANMTLLADMVADKAADELEQSVINEINYKVR